MESWKPFSSLKPNITTSVFNYSTKAAGSGLPCANEILWIIIYPVVVVRYVQETLSSRSNQYTPLTIHLSETSISPKIKANADNHSTQTLLRCHQTLVDEADLRKVIDFKISLNSRRRISDSPFSPQQLGKLTVVEFPTLYGKQLPYKSI